MMGAGVSIALGVIAGILLTVYVGLTVYFLR